VNESVAALSLVDWTARLVTAAGGPATMVVEWSAEQTARSGMAEIQPNRRAINEIPANIFRI
jgi:hypothetical protein